MTPVDENKAAEEAAFVALQRDPGNLELQRTWSEAHRARFPGRAKHRFAETSAPAAEDEARRAEAAAVAARYLLTIQLAIDEIEAGNIPQALGTLLSVPGTKTRNQKEKTGG